MRVHLFKFLKSQYYSHSYVEWSLHEPFPGVYNFEGIANLEYFLKLIKEENMYLIFRPGPYICAERDLVSKIVSNVLVYMAVEGIDKRCLLFLGWISLLVVEYDAQKKLKD